MLNEKNNKTIREQAESLVDLQDIQMFQNLEKLSLSEIQKIVHELQVHQIELKLQNEELLGIQGELEKQKERYFYLYNMAPIGHCTLNEAGLIDEINLTMSDLLGYDRNELIKQPFSHFIIPQDQDVYYLYRKKITALQEKQECELRIKKKDKSTCWIQLIGVQEASAKSFLITTKDVTEEVELRHDLIHSKELAEIATKAKADFLANMSHEIRTPMTGLLGFVERLQKGETDSDRMKQFKIIRNSGETLLHLINDILDFSKIESEKMELDFFAVNLLRSSESILENFSQLASAKNITLLNAIHENIPKCTMSDETKFKQVLSNLLSNAIKFTNNGGSITLQVYFTQQSKKLYIAVIDTGVGIARENLEKIFESFSQEDTSTTRKYGGTGLGLTISSRIVDLMGGELKVQSKVGEGSRFYFEIPIKKCSMNDLEDEQDSEQILENKTLKGHVLIVEDNKTNQMLLGMIFDDFGLSYDIVDNGAEAVLNVKQKNYNIVLMDENMPIMNGIEATQHIREYEENANMHIPIIAVTANALQDDRERFINAGMDDYISKPLQKKIL